MKKVLQLVALLFISINLFAQAPQKMSYQAVIRNASNNLVVNAPVKMKISILQGSASGNAVYSELHSATTNANGLVTIEIGAGTTPTGTFSSIEWGNGTYFLKTETDPTNGSTYSIEGTSQLLSVPYAFHADNGNKPGTTVGEMQYWDGKGWINIAPGTQGQALSFCNGKPTWGSCSAVEPPNEGTLWLTGDAAPSGWKNPLPAPFDVNQKFTRLTNTTYQLTLDLPGGGLYKLIQTQGNWNTQYHMIQGGTWESGQLEKKDADPAFIGPPTAGRYRIIVDFMKGTYQLVKE
jgi:hypothetical protein